MTDHTQVQLDIEVSIQRTFDKAKEIRPENTSRAYLSKQREFTDWCKRKRADDGETVSPGKLHLFLVEEVIGRERRIQRRDPSQKQVIGRSTVQAYTAAVVDLWNQQKRLKVNPHPNPRDDAVQQLLRNVQAEHEETRKKNFDDRGVGTLLDGYTTITELKTIADFFWYKHRDCGVHLRNLVAFLLSHYTLMRGESVRAMELPDLHSVVLDREGVSECHALILVMRQGKTNQFGRLDVAACLRNREVSACPVGILGFYFFWRWHMEAEPFPSFEKSSDWYSIKLLKSGVDLSKELDYRVHKDNIKSVFTAIGLKTKAKTHVGRGSGARMAELGGAKHLSLVMGTAVDPTKLQLQRAMPLLADRITALHQDLGSKITRVDLLLGEQMEEITSLKQQLRDIMSGRAELRLNARFDMDWPRTEELTHVPQDSHHGVVPAVSPEVELPRTYKLSRGIVTTIDLWREWTEGLGGGPAVRVLESKWGASWCEGSERRFFNRRKVIIEAIEKRASLMEGGVTNKNLKWASEWLEEERRKRSKSLDWLSKNIREISS
ncbi:hypothetical protein R1sor_008268 [Riccia sorocarpa]|uniref:Transcription activator GCR1-like domain-containing protein n=1 Tax=Riccia sorocarpa TaxID=122646 RepID=A0ABD3HWD7_9MARC